MSRFVLSPVLGVGLILALVCPESLSESASVESRPTASRKRQSAGAETERALRQRGAERGAERGAARGAEAERAAGRVSEEEREGREGRGTGGTGANEAKKRKVKKVTFTLQHAADRKTGVGGKTLVCTPPAISSVTLIGSGGAMSARAH